MSIQKDRYKVFNDYKLDRWIFTTFMLLIFVFLFWIAWYYDFEMKYFRCEKSGPTMMIGPGEDSVEYDVDDMCKNVFYEPVSWKNQRYLPPGEYGMKLSSRVYKSAWPVSIALFALAFLINHLLHNRGYKLRGDIFEEDNN